MEPLKEKQKKAFDALKSEFGYTNAFAAPRIEKVVISTTFGSKADRKQRLEFTMDRLAKITGQKPAMRVAKKSIASFKVREGEPVGTSVTLRGTRMFAFLDKLFNVAIPRMRDFRGLNRNAVDDMGNYTIGISEHTIFPETSDEDLKDVFGIAVTVVTTARSKEEATRFLELLGVPFKKKN